MRERGEGTEHELLPHRLEELGDTQPKGQNLHLAGPPPLSKEGKQSPEEGETYTSRGLWEASFLVPGAAEPVSSDEAGDPVAGGNTEGVRAGSGYWVGLQITAVGVSENKQQGYQLLWPSIPLVPVLRSQRQTDL